MTAWPWQHTSFCILLAVPGYSRWRGTMIEPGVVYLSCMSFSCTVHAWNGITRAWDHKYTLCKDTSTILFCANMCTKHSTKQGEVRNSAYAAPYQHAGPTWPNLSSHSRGHRVHGIHKFLLVLKKQSLISSKHCHTRPAWTALTKISLWRLSTTAINTLQAVLLVLWARLFAHDRIVIRFCTYSVQCKPCILTSVWIVWRPYEHHVSMNQALPTVLIVLIMVLMNACGKKYKTFLGPDWATVVTPTAGLIPVWGIWGPRGPSNTTLVTCMIINGISDKPYHASEIWPLSLYDIMPDSSRFLLLLPHDQSEEPRHHHCISDVYSKACTYKSLSPA